MKESTLLKPPANQTSKKPDMLKDKDPKIPGPKRTLGPVSDLERHLPSEWWKTLFNSLYLKTDGDVVENDSNTARDIDILIQATGIKEGDSVLDLCCGQGRHSLELARRGYYHVTGIDRSRYLIRLARKRAKSLGLPVTFSESDARHFRLPESSRDCVILMGNSFGYFERQEDDLAVLNAVKKVLKSEGKIVLDIVDGTWMAKHFEPRSWEWIDQNHFVNRERTLASDGKRIVSREVITHSDIGVLADQFYAERLYTFDEIREMLENLGFKNITLHANIVSDSTRGQDLGMMANRLFITAVAPVKSAKVAKLVRKTSVAVVMGDPRLPDTVKKDGKFNEEDFTTINLFKENARKLEGFTFDYIDNHKTLMKRLLDNPPSFVFNLCDEGFNNKATLELHVPAMLELLNIPYTGAGPGCLSLCYNKANVRAIAAGMDIPVPMETYYNTTDQAANLPSIFPALLKPNCGDSSIGITQRAVVHNAQELITYLDDLRSQLPGIPILIQEYLQGTEYSVGIIGNPGKFEALPLLEVDYSKLPKDLPQILSYESKWEPDSPYWTDIRYKEAEIDEETRRKMVDYSYALFERLECRDYARFDFRADSKGNIKLLEANPNPGWCWDGKLNLMAGFAGIDYARMLEMILNAAKERLHL